MARVDNLSLLQACICDIIYVIMTVEPFEPIWYDDPGTGKLPAKDYLESLDDRIQGRFWKILEELCKDGKTKRPWTAQIRGKIWEIRPIVAGSQDRILYATVTGRKVLLLHGVTKPGNKVPVQDIRRAEDRLEEFRSR